MQLITFIGTGRYETTLYTWQNKQVETPYVVEALCEFFQPEQVKVFVTLEAREHHWENLSNRLSERIPLTMVPIPSGKSETEIWEIFDAVVSAVEPGSKVLFDITHAFRSLPLLVLLAGAFLQKARNVEIKGVYYGAFEVNRLAPPIFDLTPAIKLLDWLTATDKFLATGSSLELGQLLSTIQQDFYRQGKQKGAEIKPKQLRQLGDRIQAISRSLELIRPLDLMEEAAEIEKIPAEQLKTELGAFAKPFELLVERIQQDYGQFALPNSRQAAPDDVLQKKFLLLRWYVKKELGTQAILLAREWVVSALCIAEGIDYLDKSQRGEVEKQLGQMTGANSNLDQPIVSHVSSAQELSATWSKLTEYRNDIAHTQMRPTSISASKLQDYVNNELIPKLTSLFPQFAA